MKIIKINQKNEELVIAEHLTLYYARVIVSLLNQYEYRETYNNFKAVNEEGEGNDKLADTERKGDGIRTFFPF